MRRTRKIGLVLAMMALLVLTTPLGAAAHHSPGHGKGKGGDGGGDDGGGSTAYTVTVTVGGEECSTTTGEPTASSIPFSPRCFLDSDQLDDLAYDGLFLDGLYVERRRGEVTRIHLGFYVAESANGVATPSNTWVRTVWIDAESSVSGIDLTGEGPFEIYRGGRKNVVGSARVSDITIVEDTTSGS